MISIDIDEDEVNRIVCNSLLNSIEDIVQYYDLAKQGVGKVFSTDAKEDAKELKKMLKGLIRTYNWYTKPSEHLEIKNYV